MVGQDARGVNLCQGLPISVTELTCRNNGLNAMLKFFEGYLDRFGPEKSNSRGKAARLLVVEVD